MARKRKTDWLDKALGTVVGEIAKGLGKRMRKALENPAPKLPVAAAAPFQDAHSTGSGQATKPGVLPPTINVFQGPTQVVVNKRRRSSVAGSRKKRSPKTDHRRPTTDAIDVDFEVKK